MYTSALYGSEFKYLHDTHTSINFSSKQTHTPLTHTHTPLTHTHTLMHNHVSKHLTPHTPTCPPTHTHTHTHTCTTTHANTYPPSYTHSDTQIIHTCTPHKQHTLTDILSSSRRRFLCWSIVRSQCCSCCTGDYSHSILYAIYLRSLVYCIRWCYCPVYCHCNSYARYGETSH